MSENFYLYQYTSLETLALILDTKMIKFTKLNLLDDPLEKYVGLLTFSSSGPIIKRTNLGAFCFVSCWTRNVEESIAMWDMYGDRKKGVRIGLPCNMMDSEYDIYQKSNKGKLFAFPKTYYPIPELVKVDYSRINDPLVNDGRTKILFNNLGKYKMPDWSFQEEYRFRLFATNDRDSTGNKYFTADQIRNGFQVGLNQPISKNQIFFKLNIDALSKITLTVGPNMPSGAHILFNILMDKYSIDDNQVSVSKFSDR